MFVETRSFVVSFSANGCDCSGKYRREIARFKHSSREQEVQGETSCSTGLGTL